MKGIWKSFCTRSVLATLNILQQHVKYAVEQSYCWSSAQWLYCTVYCICRLLRHFTHKLNINWPVCIILSLAQIKSGLYSRSLETAARVKLRTLPNRLTASLRNYDVCLQWMIKQRQGTFKLTFFCSNSRLHVFCFVLFCLRCYLTACQKPMTSNPALPTCRVYQFRMTTPSAEAAVWAKGLMYIFLVAFVNLVTVTSHPSRLFIRYCGLLAAFVSLLLNKLLSWVFQLVGIFDTAKCQKFPNSCVYCPGLGVCDGQLPNGCSEHSSVALVLVVFFFVCSDDFIRILRKNTKSLWMFFLFSMCQTPSKTQTDRDTSICLSVCFYVVSARGIHPMGGRSAMLHRNLREWG